MGVLDEAVPAVVVGNVAGRAASEKTLSVAAVVVGVGGVTRAGECLGEAGVPGAVLGHPVQHLDNGLGLLNRPAAHMETCLVLGLKRKVR